EAPQGTARRGPSSHPDLGPRRSLQALCRPGPPAIGRGRQQPVCEGRSSLHRLHFRLEHHMKRGDIWTDAAGPGYSGKPRPAMVLQDNRFDATEHMTICPFTGDPPDADIFRIPIELAPTNGLKCTF